MPGYLDGSVGETVKIDIGRLTEIKNVSVYIVDGGFLSKDLEEESNDASFIAFEDSIDGNKSTQPCRLEICLPINNCIYNINPREETVLTIAINIPSDYPQVDIETQLLSISNAEPRFTKLCRLKLVELLPIEENDVSKQSHRLYNIVSGFYRFLQQYTTQRLSASRRLNYIQSSLRLDTNEESSYNSKYGPSGDHTSRPYGNVNPVDVCMAARKGSAAVHKLLITHSRYYREFEHQKVLGSGSFGCVTKVSRSGIIYALKQIPIYKIHGNTLHEEAAVLASLQHRNIVRYYDAWIEEPYDDILSRHCMTLPMGASASVQLSLPLQSNSLSDMSNISRYNKKPEGFRLSSISRKARLHNRFLPSCEGAHHARKHKERPVKYLFILMEYCAEDNLANAINDRRLHDKPQLVIELFRQILEALSYIHEKGIIHRDIKPSNIFLKSEDGVLSIKLGDFGLTAKLNTGPSSDFTNPTGIVGTLHYMSPEQERGDSYDEKVDIFAAGVVLFEMLSPPFTTNMERADVLSSFPTEEKKWPSEFVSTVDHGIFKILESMLCIDPMKRPSASYLLQSEVFAATNLDTSTLYKVVTEYPHSMESNQLLGSLFNRTIDYDPNIRYNEVPDSTQDKSNYINVLLWNKYSQEFAKRGAIRYEAPIFVEACEEYSKEKIHKQCYHLLLDDGRTCKLRTSVLEALAETIPPIFFVIMKRWYWGKAYIKNNVCGRHPSALWQCAYSIVADYNIMLQDIGSNVNCLDAFFCADVVATAVRPLIKLPNSSVVVHWTYTDFLKSILKEAVGIPEKISESLELLMYDNIKRPNILKQKVANLIKTVFVPGLSHESLLNMVLQLAETLPITGTPAVSDVISPIAKILRSYGRNLDVFTLESSNVYYMESFLNINECSFIFLPLGFPVWHRRNYSKFSFAVNYTIDKKEFFGLLNGGCINSLMPQSKGIMFGSQQRYVFGFELQLEPLMTYYNTREAATFNKTGTNSLQLGCHLLPQVLICVHNDSLMNRAILLENGLQQSGIVVEKQLGIPSSMRKLRKHKVAGFLQLSRLQVIVLIKQKLSQAPGKSPMHKDDDPNEVEYKVYYIDTEFETVGFYCVFYILMPRRL
ncbi:Ser/Thr protein kinase domain containing protein [Babesia bovis T2Bo]|uniref:Ser/Thr protein kinase, putative n=1 Tax=Babesia bovis TaxID=5865 RepID=A7AUM8_BABBO|nr:Ser/Thr protein kinase domain containing protein [Babesia bovis T2Bo]EDO06639.1 Ser/Thr protein kinase domain containing protein [Babesia bovis T2Bo]|eukprot:XP_001610207.1 Ser/Thr protein kinase [Babesia bovis T2Bo]